MRKAEFVESYFEAWNHRNARLVADHLTAGGTYCDIPEQQQHSRDELLANLTGFFAANNHHYELIGEILTGRDSIAFQYCVSSSDAFTEPFFGAEFVTLDGGGAARILDYYSIPGLVRPADHMSLVSSAAFTQKYTKSGLSDAQSPVAGDQFRIRHEFFRLSESVQSRICKAVAQAAGWPASVGIEYRVRGRF